jgi:Domain of unknown function (DUF4386)
MLRFIGWYSNRFQDGCTTMAVVPAVKTASNGQPVAAWPRRSVLTGSRMTVSRLIGALFLAGTLTYGVGSILAKSVTDSSSFLSTISADHSILVLGAFLILLNTPVDIAKAVFFFPILEQHGRRTALAYLATMIFEVVFLSLGAFCLLMIVPLGKHAGEGWAQGLAPLLVQSNTTAYQIGEAALGFGALFLCALLWRSRLIPPWIAISGLIGYACLMAGQVAEIFGIPIGTYLTIPGAFFELAMPIWLFTKGFQPEAYRGQPTVKPTA